MHVTVSEEMNAKRRTPPSAIIRITPTTKQAAAVRSGVCGRPIDGLRSVVSPPRASTVRERSAITTMMTTNGMASPRPCWGSQVHTVMSLVISDWAQPISSPASAVSQNDWNRPTSAAARAGTTNRV